MLEIETDKTVQDFESEFNGVLLKQGVEEGGAAPVDSVLAIIGPAGTDVSAVGAPKAAGQSTENQLNKKQKLKQKKKLLRLRTLHLLDRVAISPLAKKMAQDKGVDINSVQGSGENGRIVKKILKTISQLQNQLLQLLQQALLLLQ